MDNYDEFWKRNVKVDTWLEIFLDLGQLVKIKIKVIKVKEEKWLIKNKN